MGSQFHPETGFVTRQVFTRDVRLDTVKAAITFAACGSDREGTRQWAVDRWGADGAPNMISKAETPALSVADNDPTTTSGLIDRELFKAVKERAVLFRMRGWRRTGFNVRSITVSSSRGVWVEEGKAIPVLQPEITAIGLDPSKIAGLSVWTREALESSPGIEQLVFDDLARAFADAADFAMFDPTNDGTGGAPASMTYGAPAISATSDVAEDIAVMISDFTGNLATAIIVTTPQVAAGLSGYEIGRDVGARGGDIAGIPVLTSAGLPEGQLTLLDPSFVLAAHDEDIELGTSKHGTIEMLDANLTGDAIAVVPGTAASMVNMFATNCVSIRGVARFSWAAARAGVVSSITGLFPTAS